MSVFLSDMLCSVTRFGSAERNLEAKCLELFNNKVITRNQKSLELFFCVLYFYTGFLSQAMDAAQLADDLKAQLELAQKKLHDFQEEIVENRVTREKEMFNFKRAEVYILCTILQYLSALVSFSLYIELGEGFN